MWMSMLEKNRKALRFSDVVLSVEEKKTLIGFHAFTGNDHVSSFFGKGKMKCWKILKSDPLFMDMFISFGSTWQLDSETFKVLEKYLCQLHGRKRQENVNDARYKMFKDTYEKKMVIPYLSLLPPCQETLELLYIWKLSTQNRINLILPGGGG